MKNYILLLVMMYGFIGCKIMERRGTQINIGRIDKLNSEILGESRNVWVHTPINLIKGKKYPVLYLLDGPSHFYSVVGMIRQLSSNGNTVLPEMIVVAIPNTDRGRDLTPTHVDLNYYTGDSLQFKSGGGNLFLDFIEKELIPYIDKKYPTTAFRTFVGHSFGGLSVINALITKTHIFNNYLAIDPSLWWDDMECLNYSDSILSARDFKNKGLFVGAANTLKHGIGISNVEVDTSKTSAHIRSILKFVKSREAKNNGLQFNWKYYQEDNHNSVPLISEYDGLRFLFSWHELKDLDKFYESTISIDESIELLRSHYKNVSVKMGAEILPDQGLINDIGYTHLRNKKLERAAAYFDLNIANYPERTDPYDSRGDCYLAAQDSVSALKFFKKALEVGKNNYSKKKIKMLTKKLAD